MKAQTEEQPQSIRLLLLKTAYPNITKFNPACSSELLSLLSTHVLPENISLLFLHVFGTAPLPQLKGTDYAWLNSELSGKPALREALQKEISPIC